MVSPAARCCSWCGAVFVGEPDRSLTLHETMRSRWFGDKVEPLSDRTFEYCCMGCAWAWGIEHERALYRMSGASVRDHLIREHGLKYASAGGPQSLACRELMVSEARDLAEFFIRCRLEQSVEVN